MPATILASACPCCKKNALYPDSDQCSACGWDGCHDGYDFPVVSA